MQDVVDTVQTVALLVGGLIAFGRAIKAASFGEPRNQPSDQWISESSVCVAVLCSLVLCALDVSEQWHSFGSSIPVRQDRLRTRICADFGAFVGLFLVFASLRITRASTFQRVSPNLVSAIAAISLASDAASLASCFGVTLDALSAADLLFLGALSARGLAQLVTLARFASQRNRTNASMSDEEAPLLNEPDAQENPSPVDSAKGDSSSWVKTVKHMRQLFPYLMPRSLYLKSMVACCMFLLLCGRIINVIVPLQYKYLVDTLTYLPPDQDRTQYYAWGAVLTYCSLRYLQSGGGIISSLQSLAWIPVSQFNSREISVQMLKHLHSLSLQFHINRKTGEVLRVMDRGTSSIGSILSAFLFNLIPTFVDIFIAVFWFMNFFDYLTGFVVLTTMLVYIVITIYVTEWRTRYRREMNQLDQLSRARAVDSLLNFETVKYYNNESFEVSRFQKSVLEYQAVGWKSQASYMLVNLAQNTVITTGLAVGCLLCAGRVVRGELTVGDFIMFISYLVQLYGPLNSFGGYYRMLQQNFVDMESMLDLLNENASIADAPDAGELKVAEGEIRFENVSFAYDSRQQAIENVTFSVPAKTTTALVGQSGSGKSTLFRLLFRFYDPQSGRILIDGQDVRNVTQSSLRQIIGVVPQDTVCFNDTIGYNIGYGNVLADTAAIHNAAQRAQIHERILSFPDGYDTKVGERGLRLSGGEKQRVAIARTLLKDPKIILLDEATSALDNTTEALIQRSLMELTSRRTTLVIAHRLSTIVDADCILVMKEGKIVERGTHTDLLAAGERRASLSGPDGKFKVGDGEDLGWMGTYYHMWMRQLEDPLADVDDLKLNETGDGEAPKQVVEVKRVKGGGKSDRRR